MLAIPHPASLSFIPWLREKAEKDNAAESSDTRCAFYSKFGLKRFFQGGKNFSMPE